MELLDELQNPRIVALQMFKGQLARLIIKQCRMLEVSGQVYIGRTGSKKSASIADLKDPDKYTVNYQLMKQNKRLAIVNEARALSLWGKAPMKYILRDILSVEDPDGWEREMELERAKAANPAIGLADMAVKFAEEAENTEDEADKELLNHKSKMLVHDYVLLMRARMNPAPVGGEETQNLREATKQTGNSNALISLMGQAGAGMPGGG